PRSVFDRAGAAALAAAAQDESPPRIDYNPRHDRQIPVANLDLAPWSGRRSSPVSEPRPILDSCWTIQHPEESRTMHEPRRRPRPWLFLSTTRPPERRLRGTCHRGTLLASRITVETVRPDVCEGVKRVATP